MASRPVEGGAESGAIQFDDSRQVAALEIARRRQVHARLLDSGRWRPYRGEGALTTLDYSDPVEALEAAETVIAAAELSTAETRSRRLIAALSRGSHAPWPRIAVSGDIEWAVLNTADRSLASVWFPGLIPALIELARLVAEPVDVG